MKSKTEQLLLVMKVLAWVACIGLLIKTGAIIISYAVSIVNVDATKDLYKGMDLSGYRDYSFIHYTFLVWYKVILGISQAYIAFLLTKLLSSLNVARPFNPDVVNLLQKISYSILFVWIVVMIHNIHMGVLEKRHGLAATYITGEFIFLAGIVYVLAQMFKRGVQIQSENELTI